MFDDPTTISDVSSCLARLDIVAMRVPRQNDATASALMCGTKETRDDFVQTPCSIRTRSSVLRRKTLRTLVLAAQGSLSLIVDCAQYDTDAAFAGRLDA